jgi:hypothetical protein
MDYKHEQTDDCRVIEGKWNGWLTEWIEWNINAHKSITTIVYVWLFKNIGIVQIYIYKLHNKIKNFVMKKRPYHSFSFNYERIFHIISNKATSIERYISS